MYLLPDGAANMRPARRFTRRAAFVAREQFSVLFTVTSLIDALEGNGAALAQFAGTTFV